MITVRVLSLASMALMSLAFALPASATPQLLTQAKSAGMPAQNCQYCHVTAMPKKEGFKPDDRCRYRAAGSGPPATGCEASG